MTQFLRITIALFCFLAAFGLSGKCQNMMTQMHRDTIICNLEPVDLILSAPDESSFYLWNNGDPEREIYIDEPGDYWVQYLNNGEIATDTFHIRSGICQNKKGLFMPTAFSPNGDGINDELHLFIDEQTELIRFVIFDRRGNAVFETADISEGWDGRYRGVLLSTGTYVYFVSYRVKGSQEILSDRGNITLIR